MNNLIYFLLCIIILTACKKSSDSDTPPATTNYIKIDDDSRQLGDIPSTEVVYVQTDYTEETLLSLSTSTKAVNIDGSKNQYLTISIALFEGGASNTEYKIENVANRTPSSAAITVILQGNDINAGMNGKSGKLYVTRDANNNIKSFKFENVQMDGNYEAVVSCNVVVK